MAVTKRTRFEVLRRDNYTCRYCKSTDNPLTVDHVTPVALGGSDDFSNLVAACRDCNYGKGSSSLGPDAVAPLSDEQIRYERARAIVVARMEEEARERYEERQMFLDAWMAHAGDCELPDDWKSGVTTWLGRGLSIYRLVEAVEIAGSKTHIPRRAVYAYMAKIAWNWVTELEEAIASEMAAEPTGDVAEEPA